MFCSTAPREGAAGAVRLLPDGERGRLGGQRPRAAGERDDAVA